jgi:hypothetical protein
MDNGTSEYERAQIESLLQPKDVGIERGLGLFLMPQQELFEKVHDIAVLPAMRSNGVNTIEAVRVFGSESMLAEVSGWLQSAEVIVADLTGANPDVMFVAGLACGMRRCPILISQAPLELPFNLAALRCVSYEQGNLGLWLLRDNLTRAIRIFLAAAREEYGSNHA